MIDMELGPIRPPSEAESLMLRVTRGIVVQLSRQKSKLFIMN